MKKIMFIFLAITAIMCYSSVDAKAQNTQLKITITDENGDPMPGVSIIVKGTMVGTTTDIYGEAIITCPINAVLVISYLGYVSVEVSVQDLLNGPKIIKLEPI